MGVTLDQIIPRLYCTLLSKATKNFLFIPKFMRVVERHYIDRQHQFYKQFDDLSFLYKNPYVNGKYYMIKQFFTSGDKVCSSRILRQLTAILKPTDSAQSFPANISNQVFKQIIKQVVHDWEDCRQSRIAYHRDLTLFFFLASIPQYKPKIWGRNLLSHDNPSIEKRGGDTNNGLLNLSQYDIIISTKSHNVIKVTIGFETALYWVDVAHPKLVTLVDLNSHFIAGINLGIDRLVALVSNKQIFTPTIYDKKNLKSIHQGFNQRRTFLLSKVDQAKFTTRQLQQISFNRNQRLENYLYQTSSLIFRRAGGEKIIQLIIGTNVRNKQNLKLEKKHHNFGVIPHTQLMKFITCKTELVGIKVIVTQAYYTNKCRLGDLDPVDKQESYQGKIGKRGRFRSWNESRINADVNGELNMIKKVNVNSPP